MSNYEHKTLYIGITNDLKRRIYEHQNGINDGFTKKYNLKKLIYYESTTDIKAAIQREKNLKKWNRDWKLELIRKMNPEFRDLSKDI